MTWESALRLVLRMGTALELREEGVAVPAQLFHQAGARRIVTVDGEVFDEAEEAALIGIGRIAHLGEDGNLAIRGEMGKAGVEQRHSLAKGRREVGGGGQAAIDEF